MPVVLPDWCELVRGDGPVLLVAPHGGRRPPVDPNAPPANLKVNDVHTAALTRELAARLDATAVINSGCDRNRLDLNRLSQVRRYAPWFLEVLRDRIATILSDHPRAEILFVHGWNVGQAKCDFGIGARETDDLVPPPGAGLTVTRAYLDERILPLRESMEKRAIATFIGIRYPASHRNNLLQVFSDHDVAERSTALEQQIAAWVSEGRVEAVQLELGVPLRWPGPRREALMQSLREHFGARATHAAAPSLPSFPPHPRTDRRSTRLLGVSPSSKARHATSLQFYDAAADLGLIAGVGPIGRTTSAARLLLFLGGQRVALFTGEQAPAAGLHVEPLGFDVDDSGMTLCFAGSLLDLDDGATYLDLEAAFAGSSLRDAAVELRFTRLSADPAGAEFGRVEGWVDLGDARRRVSAGAFVNAAAARAGQRSGYMRLAVDFGDACGVLLHEGEGIGANVVEFCQRGIDRRQGSVSAAKEGSLPGCVSMGNGSTMRANPVSRMEILRSLPSGEYARVTFGTARFQWEGRDGRGIYELAKPCERKAPSAIGK